MFNEWQLTLERLVYTNFTRVLNAKDYGVPQNRERVFMVSVLDCIKTFYFPDKIPLTKCLRDILEDNVGKEYYLSERMIKTFDKLKARYKRICGLGWKPTDGSGIATTVTTASLHQNSNYIIIGNGRVRRLTPTECFRLMGVSNEDIKKICAAVSRTQAYKLAGNSIVVDVLALIFSQLFRGNSNKHQQTEIF